MDNIQGNPNENAGPNNQFPLIDVDDHEEDDIDVECDHELNLVPDAPLPALQMAVNPPADNEEEQPVAEMFGLFEDLRMVVPSTSDRAGVARHIILREGHSHILVLTQENKDLTERQRDQNERLRILIDRLKDLTDQLDELTKTTN